MKDTRPIKVQVEKLNMSFSELNVLKDISFQVRKGEFLCVVGPTGCGKTTFLNLMTRLYEPTSGEIRIDGKPANPQVHSLSFVFQEPSAYPWLTVEQNIAFGMEIKHFPRKKIKENVDEILHMMGMEQFRHCLPSQLSASSEQKVVIGRAFAMRPDLLLMDEPYAQMDLKTRFFLEDEVLRMWKELGTTVIFITHNIEEAVYLAERIIILSQKPAYIKEEVVVDLPRPRDVSSSEFIALRKHVTDTIKWW